MTNPIVRTAESMFGGKPNLSFTERAGYIVVGLGLAAAGAKPRPNPLLNILAIVGGGAIAYAGYKGHCPIKAALMDHSASTSTHDRLTEVSKSLPASSPVSG